MKRIQIIIMLVIGGGLIFGLGNYWEYSEARNRTYEWSAGYMDPEAQAVWEKESRVRRVEKPEPVAEATLRYVPVTDRALLTVFDEFRFRPDREWTPKFTLPEGGWNMMMTQRMFTLPTVEEILLHKTDLDAAASRAGGLCDLVINAPNERVQLQAIEALGMQSPNDEKVNTTLEVLLRGGSRELGLAAVRASFIRAGRVFNSEEERDAAADRVLDEFRSQMGLRPLPRLTPQSAADAPAPADQPEPATEPVEP